MTGEGERARPARRPLNADAGNRRAVGELQAWLQAAIMHPGGAAAAAAAPEVRAKLPPGARSALDELEPSSQLDAIARLDVYCEAYYLRLRGVMREDFPATRRALDSIAEGAFDRVVRDYLTACPSRSFTLNQLGARFAAFLAHDADAPEVREHRTFLAELAALERAKEDVFHERLVAPVDVASLESIPPPQWERAHFALNPALRLLRSDHPVNRYLQDVLDDRSPVLPDRGESFVAVYRKDERVWRARLTSVQFELLDALGRGDPLGAVLERILAAAGERGPEISASLGAWFREWTADGFFAAIEVA